MRLTCLNKNGKMYLFKQDKQRKGERKWKSMEMK